MRADEYDAADRGPDRVPVQRLAAARLHARRPIGEPVTYEHNLSLLKGGMAMMQYFQPSARQIERLRSECGHRVGHRRHPQGADGHPGRQAPRLPGPGRRPVRDSRDKVRGRLRGAGAAPVPRGPDHGRPDRQRARSASGCTAAACRSCRLDIFNEHLLGHAQADHRGALGGTATRRCSTPKATGTTTSTPSPNCPTAASSITSTRATSSRSTDVLGDKFCLSGGIPNALLAFGQPDEVRQRCKEIIEGVARDGGYIMDASAIVQNDAKVENIRAMTEADAASTASTRAAQRRGSRRAGGRRPVPQDARRVLSWPAGRQAARSPASATLGREAERNPARSKATKRFPPRLGRASTG